MRYSVFMDNSSTSIQKPEANFSPKKENLVDEFIERFAEILISQVTYRIENRNSYREIDILEEVETK